MGEQETILPRQSCLHLASALLAPNDVSAAHAAAPRLLAGLPVRPLPRHHTSRPTHHHTTPSTLALVHPGIVRIPVRSLALRRTAPPRPQRRAAERTPTPSSATLVHLSTPVTRPAASTSRPSIRQALQLCPTAAPHHHLHSPSVRRFEACVTLSS